MSGRIERGEGVNSFLETPKGVLKKLGSHTLEPIKVNDEEKLQKIGRIYTDVNIDNINKSIQMENRDLDWLRGSWISRARQKRREQSKATEIERQVSGVAVPLIRQPKVVIKMFDEDIKPRQEDLRSVAQLSVKERRVLLNNFEAQAEAEEQFGKAHEEIALKDLDVAKAHKDVARLERNEKKNKIKASSLVKKTTDNPKDIMKIKMKANVEGMKIAQKLEGAKSKLQTAEVSLQKSESERQEALNEILRRKANIEKVTGVEETLTKSEMIIEEEKQKTDEKQKKLEKNQKRLEQLRLPDQLTVDGMRQLAHKDIDKAEKRKQYLQDVGVWPKEKNTKYIDGKMVSRFKALDEAVSNRLPEDVDANAYALDRRMRKIRRMNRRSVEG